MFRSPIIVAPQFTVTLILGNCFVFVVVVVVVAVSGVDDVGVSDSGGLGGA